MEERQQLCQSTAGGGIPKQKSGHQEKKSHSEYKI